MCSVCGSTKEQSTFFYFINTPSVRTESPLEDWLKQRGIEHTHNWVHYLDVGENANGNLMRCSLKEPPAIFQLTSEIMEFCISEATDEEILAFYERIKDGSEEEKEKTVKDLIQSVSDSQTVDEKQ